MKRAVLECPAKIVVKEVPEPVLDEDEVLIKVEYCGICGSDLHVWETGAALGIGHELSGSIVEVGPSVEGWRSGDRVIRKPGGPAESACGGRCFWCSRGETALCEGMDADLLGYTSGFATYVKSKHWRLYGLPDWLSYEEAALTEPTAVAVHAVNRANMQVGDTVAVLGMGPIGQLVARVARISGAGATYATEKTQVRIKLARDVVDEVIDVGQVDPVGRLLELTEGRGADVVFECSGNPVASLQSILVARKGGTIVVVSVCLESFVMPFGTINLKELTLKGSMIWKSHEYAAAFDLITQRKINVAPLVTTRMPLDRINEAFERAFRGDGGKIMVKP
jgi:2-desacetyl-2-hydroxyethyl bacteriochlorophyllide A dehydrogenase